MSDLRYMKMAFNLARRALGTVWPNPAVGCVIVDRAGHVVGCGHTRRGGRPHAETEALAQAGPAARGGTAYVTLEPCAHQGQTGPCAGALAAAGVSRVVVATGDPDPRVAGAGIKMLKKAGVTVDMGCGQAVADQLNAGYFTRCRLRRPLVTVKIASSLDGRIATGGGHSRWITGEAARKRGHLLRASHDAIMVGLGTVCADDPLLDCRLPGLEDRSPVRIILDSRLNISADCRLLATAETHPTWVITTITDKIRHRFLTDKGVTVIVCGKDADGRVDMAKMLEMLGGRGITRLLCEGGAKVNASLIKASLLDRLYWFRAPTVIGGDGLSAIGAMGNNNLDDLPRFSVIDSGQAGADSWQELKREL